MSSANAALNIAQAGAARWQLTRRCALTPRQMLLSFWVIAVASALTAALFAWHGVWLVPFWCLIEVILAGAMYLLYMIHAIDGEQITLDAQGRLAVDVVRGMRTHHYEMNPCWSRLERGGPHRDRLWLCCRRLRVEVATQLPVRERRRIESEIRRALAVAQAGRPAMDA
jgi:uncharacterized membrane protein